MKKDRLVRKDELAEYKFVHIATGEEFTSAYPEKVSSIHGEHMGDLWVTKIDSAKKGDPDYFDVLVASMFMQGWLCVNRKTAEPKRYR